MMDAIKEWWGALMALTGLGIWLVRLEGSARTALREIGRLEKRLDDDRRAALENRKEQNEMLREMRADIKRLLERSGSRD